MHNIVRELVQVARYNLERKEVPWGLPRNTEKFLSVTSDAIRSSRDFGIEAGIALPFSGERWQKSHVELLISGRFRSDYKLIRSLAPLLAPAFLSCGVLPIIIPVPNQQLKAIDWSGPWVRRIRNAGLTIYESEE